MEIEDIDSNDIDVIIDNWYKINKELKTLKEMDEKLRAKIKIHLKEREWDSYKNDANKINVRIVISERETADLKQLKHMLDEADYLRVVKVTSFEKMNIITPEIRSRMGKYSRG